MPNAQQWSEPTTGVDPTHRWAAVRRSLSAIVAWSGISQGEPLPVAGGSDVHRAGAGVRPYRKSRMPWRARLVSLVSLKWDDEFRAAVALVKACRTRGDVTAREPDGVSGHVNN